jgi:hypothetical protein
MTAGDYSLEFGVGMIAEYLPCRRPIFARRVSSQEELFRDLLASVCDPDPNSMAEALRRQLRSPEIAPLSRKP